MVHKVDDMITTNDFIKNKVDQCIYLKTNGIKFIFLVILMIFCEQVMILIFYEIASYSSYQERLIERP